MGSGASNPLEGMSLEEVAQMEVAYSKAKEDGLEGLDLIQVTSSLLLICKCVGVML
jgi:predicted ribosome quality control (RQC) complex YloA/Tae2 family protein